MPYQIAMKISWIAFLETARESDLIKYSLRPSAQINCKDECWLFRDRMDELLKHEIIIFESLSLEHEEKSVILVERELDKL